LFRSGGGTANESVSDPPTRCRLFHFGSSVSSVELNGQVAGGPLAVNHSTSQSSLHDRCWGRDDEASSSGRDPGVDLPDGVIDIQQRDPVRIGTSDSPGTRVASPAIEPGGPGQPRRRDKPAAGYAKHGAAFGYTGEC